MEGKCGLTAYCHQAARSVHAAEPVRRKERRLSGSSFGREGFNAVSHLGEREERRRERDRRKRNRAKKGERESEQEKKKQGRGKK